MIALIYAEIKGKVWGRNKALLILLSIFFPFFFFFLSDTVSNSQLSEALLPFGFVLNAVLISSVIFDDLQRQVQLQTQDLGKTIDDLRDEIVLRQKLESDLLNSQNVLAQKLSGQTTKLAGLYDLILISNENIGFENLLTRSLEKIASVMNCQVVNYFRLEQDHFVLESSFPSDNEHSAPQMILPIGWIMHDREIRADPDISVAYDLPPDFGANGYLSSLSKCVIVQDREVGLLAVFWKVRRNFSVEEIALFGALADGLGLILENTRLRQEAAMIATRQERQRLARDIHDSVSQSIHSMMLSAQTAKKQLLQNPEKMVQTLTHLETSSKQALREMRLLIYELRLSTQTGNGFIEWIQFRLVAVEKRAGIATDLIISKGVVWQKQWESELFHIVMEALNNSIKHAYASQVSVKLSGNHNSLTLEVSDNGVGFNPEQISTGGMGLHTMQERCEQLGGDFQIVSQPGQGTSILIHMENMNPSK